MDTKVKKNESAQPTPEVKQPEPAVTQPTPPQEPMTAAAVELMMRERQLVRQATAISMLRKPFAEGEISYKPQRLIKADEYDKLPRTTCEICGGYHPANEPGKRRVVGHLSYVGHAAVTNRLLDADPLWFWEPLSFTENGGPHFDATGGLWIKLSVAGMTRLGYGQSEKMPYSEIGSQTKAIIGDAIRNAAMRFGVALDQWHKGELGLPDPTLLQSLGLDTDSVQTQTTGKPAIEMPVAVEKKDAEEKVVRQPQEPNATDKSETLAEEGEVKFISKKLCAIQDPDTLIKNTIGRPSIDNLTKAEFALLKEAVKGAK